MSVARSSARPPPADGPGSSSKGRQTRQAILNAAVDLVAQVGLEGLSIGALAEAAGMSKSGVFAHFGSREDLQIAVIENYREAFSREVFLPALELPRGLPRLQRMVQLWMQRILSGEDCGIFISGAVDFDDRPGPVYQALRDAMQEWIAALLRAVEAAQEQGHLRRDVAARQLVFEMHALVLALYYEVRFLRNADAPGYAAGALQRLLKNHAGAGVLPDLPGIAREDDRSGSAG